MKKTFLVFCIFATILLTSCAQATISPEDLDATLAVALEQTIAAQPTNTPTITPTASPTATSTSTPEPTELPTTSSYFVEFTDDGWAHYTYEGEGFKISLPPNWQHLDLFADDLELMFEMASESIPELGDLYSPGFFMAMIDAGMKFMAVDYSADSLFSASPSSLNLMVIDLPFDLTFDDYIDMSILQLKSVLGEDTPMQNERLEINGQVAEKLTYVNEVYDPAGTPHAIVLNQYLFLHGRTQYILTIGSAEELSSTRSDILSEIATSFEIIQ